MIALVDYGMGNLRSVEKACRLLGYACQITAKPEGLVKADAVILPGVGAFGQAMQNLRNTGLYLAVREAAASGKPFLGICLGMQLLFAESTEYGTHQGLGLLPGSVTRFPEGLKVPHMGWNQLTYLRGPLFAGVPEQTPVYFVHSYFAPTGAYTAAACEYSLPFSAAVQGEGNLCNLFGTQFHPEKSGEAGLRILGNFCRLGEQNAL